MGFLENLKKTLLGADFENDEGFFDDGSDEDEVEDTPRDSSSKDSRRTREREYTEFSDYRHKKTSSDGKIVHLTTDQKDKIVISMPKTVQDAPAIAEYLISSMTCVINLEGVDHSNAQRIADFLGGAAYALSCEIEKVNNDVFVIAPAHMNISSELKEDSKSTSSILPWIASAFK